MNSLLITYSTSKQSVEFSAPQSVRVELDLDYQRHKLIPEGPYINDIVCFRFKADDGQKKFDLRIDSDDLIEKLRRACERFSFDEQMRKIQSLQIGSIQNASEKRRRRFAFNEVQQGLSGQIDKMIDELKLVSAALTQLKSKLDEERK